MTTRDVCPNFQERCCSKLPIKIPHVRYKEGRRYPCCYAAMYSTPCGEEMQMNIGTNDPISCHPKLTNHQYLVDKSTQMSLKNFYDSYLFEGLLTTNGNIKQNDLHNNENTADEPDSLSDIKNILLTTNAKLDIILNTLEKTEHPINMASKQRKSKVKLKQKLENFKSPSHLSLSVARSEDMGDMQTHMSPWAKCLSSTCISRLQPNPYYISPYFPPYYVKPISHYNSFKVFGPKYSDPDMTSNIWSPFMFMANSFNVKKIQSSANKEKLAHGEDNNGVPVNVNGQNVEGIEYSGDNSDYSPCEGEMEPVELPN